MIKRYIIILSAAALTGCSGAGRVCEKPQPGAENSAARRFVIEWNPAPIASISIGGLDFYAGGDYVREMRFDDNGDWLLRYEQGGVRPRNTEACDGPGSGYEKVTNIWAYRFAADEGDFGTVYHWYEKPAPDICDSDGDGIITEYVQIAPDLYRQKTPYRFQCIGESGLFNMLAPFGWFILI